MHSLSAHQLLARDGLLQRLAAAHVQIEVRATLLQDVVNDKIAAYNAVLAEARSFADAIAEQIDDYRKEHANGWFDSPEGKAFLDWSSEWRNLPLQDIPLLTALQLQDAYAIEFLERASIQPLT